MGLTLCCGNRENAGGRNEMGASAVIWAVSGLSVELDGGEEERAVVWYDRSGIDGIKVGRVDERSGMEE